MTIALTTPEQINAWVLLSRISQCHLHLKGYPVKGLLKWLKANIPDCATARTVKDAYPRLLDYTDTLGLHAPGGEMCNYQILVTGTGAGKGLYLDHGIVDSMADIEANPDFVRAYAEGRLVILRTMDKTRERDPKVRMVMD